MTEALLCACIRLSLVVPALPSVDEIQICCAASQPTVEVSILEIIRLLATSLEAEGVSLNDTRIVALVNEARLVVATSANAGGLAHDHAIVEEGFIRKFGPERLSVNQVAEQS